MTATAEPERAVTVAQLEADAAWEAERAARTARDTAQRDLLYYKRLNARNRPLLDAFHRISNSVHAVSIDDLTADAAVCEIREYVRNARDKALAIERVQGEGR